MSHAKASVSNPRVSILTPTLNSARTLTSYFEAIRAQRYPQDAIELIIADGGSSDSSREIAARYGARILDNPLRTGEAGKAVALRYARGDIVAFVDSDNILVGDDWLLRMVAPFEDPNIVGAEPMLFSAERGDSIVDRYCALAGVNDPTCLFMGNYDKYSVVTGKWTDLELHQQERGDYVTFPLGQPLPTIGANGTLYRRSSLKDLRGEYFMDIDVPCILGTRDPSAEFAKVRTSIRHLYATDVRDFAWKQRRRIRDYFSKRQRAETERVYPWHLYARRGILRFAFFTLTVVPLLWQTLSGYNRARDSAIWFHPVACWVTLWIYGANFVFARGRSLSRQGWQMDARRFGGPSSP